MSNPVIDEGGNKHWYQNGIRHRVDGPALEFANGSKYWYQNGKQHRVDGPAIEFSDGSKYWYADGKSVSFPKEFQKVTNLSDEDMMVLILKYS